MNHLTRKALRTRSFQGGEIRWAKAYQCQRRCRFTVHQAKVLTTAAARRAARAAGRDEE